MMNRFCNRFRGLGQGIQNNSAKNTKDSQNYPKDSFDRFGDDMVRLLLSYHSFDDRFNTIKKRCLHECVSKQFQRVIFNRVNDLNLYLYITNGLMKKMLKKDIHLSSEEFCHKLIAFLQKKCPNIQSVYFWRDSYYKPSTHLRSLLEAMNQLRNNWPYLKSIEFFIKGPEIEYKLNNQLLVYLIQTFGPMITKCEYENESQFLPDLSNCHNLCQLSTPNLGSVFTADDNDLLLFKRLKKIGIDWSYDKFNGNRFKTFIAYYKSRITCLNIFGISSTIDTLDNESIIRLTEFQELRELRLEFKGDGPLQYSIYDQLKTIGIKCLKLKKFSIDVYSWDPVLNIEILNAMQYMRRLKRLHLEFSRVWYEVTDWTQLQALDLWPQLTHLWIKLWDISREVIEEIVSKQHRLQTLDIQHFVNIDIVFDTKWLVCIPKQSSLESLSIYSMFTNIKCKTSDLKRITKNCPKMRSLMVYYSRFDGKRFDYPIHWTIARELLFKCAIL